MQIGLVIYDHLDVISGGYLYDRKLVEFWRRQGHEVLILALPSRSYCWHLVDNFLPAWRRRLREAPVDVLVVDELSHPSVVLLVRGLSRQKKIPVVSLNHLLRSTEPKLPVLRYLYRAVERYFLNSVDAHVHNSQDTARQVLALSQQVLPAVVAYPGRDHWLSEIGPADIEVRAKASGGLKILYVGNVIERKGLHILLDALSRIPPQDWCLTVVGRLDLEPRYVARINAEVKAMPEGAQVNVIGEIPFAEMPKIFSAHQLFVMPSLYEPFGIVYVEAMGAGLPLIASSAGASAELVGHGRSGFIVAPEHPLELQSYVQRFIDDRALLVQFGQQALNDFHGFPRWDDSAQLITDFLSELTSESMSKGC